ncbi:MAG: ABC transporter permease [Nitrospiraceae bacterium]
MRWALRLTVVWGLLAVALPLAMILAVSVATRETYGTIAWTVTLDNYLDLLHPLYGRILFQSIGMAVLTTVLCFVLGFPLAYLLARSRPTWQRIGLVLTIIPLWTNFLVRTYAWIVLLQQEGVVNGTLAAIGAMTEPLPLLFTPGAVIVGLVYGYLPFMVLPIYGAMERIPMAVEEAARDLYASTWTVLLRIVAPLALPGIASGSLLVFLASFGAYLTPDLLGGAKTMMVGNLIQHEFLAVRDWPLGAALAVMVVVVALAVVAIGRTVERRWNGLVEASPASPAAIGSAVRS